MTAAELKKVVERINDNSIGTKRANARREAWKERNLAIFTLLMVTGIRVTALTELNMEDISGIRRLLGLLISAETLMNVNLMMIVWIFYIMC